MWFLRRSVKWWNTQTYSPSFKRGNDANSMWDAVGWQADCSISGNCVSIHRHTKGALERTSARRFGLILLQVSPCHSHLLFNHEKHGSLCYVSVRWVHIRWLKRWRRCRVFFFRFCLVFWHARRWMLAAPSSSRLRSASQAGRKWSTVQTKVIREVIREVIRTTTGDDMSVLPLFKPTARAQNANKTQTLFQRRLFKWVNKLWLDANEFAPRLKSHEEVTVDSGGGKNTLEEITSHHFDTAECNLIS